MEESYVNNTTFVAELENLINKYSKEKGSDTPDFILANYLARCLNNFDMTIKDREKFYGREAKEVENPPKNPEDITVADGI
jgi:hypothetical protein